MAVPVTLIPGDGIGPTITERDGSHSGGGGRRHRMGSTQLAGMAGGREVRRSDA